MTPDPVAEFRGAMAAAGLQYSGQILGDGKLHRFNVDGEKGNASYYSLHIDAHPAGSFGCHRRGLDGSWHASANGNLKPADMIELRKLWRADELKREQEKLQTQKFAAAKAQRILDTCPKATPDHVYLKRKQVPPLGDLRKNAQGELVLPLRDADGHLHSLQTIDAEGDKLFLPGSRVQGVFFTLCDRLDGPLIIAEGYATAATCHLATGWSAVAALNCGNLKLVCASLKKLHPQRTIIIAADDDRFTKDNPGQRHAKEAAAQFKPPLPIATPEFSDQDLAGTDFNDLAAMSGLGIVASLLESSIPAAVAFKTPNAILSLSLPKEDQILGDHLLTKSSLIAILAAGGVGKSRLILQMAASINAHHEKCLAWDIHPQPKTLRWLIIQAENSARRLQSDLTHLRDWLTPAAWTEFSNNVHILTPIQELDSRLDLDCPENVSRLQSAISLYQPDIVVFDALYNFSLRELRFGAEMLATITNCTRLARFQNPRRSVIILHHALTGEAGAARAVGYDRASFGRDSKVFHQLARSVINIAPLPTPDNLPSDQFLVSCGKCSDGKEFLPFAIHLHPESLLYLCDPTVDVAQAAQILRNPNKKQSLMPPSRVRELCSVAGSSKKDLAAAIQEDCGCTKFSAYRFIRSASDKGQISTSTSSGLFLRN